MAHISLPTAAIPQHSRLQQGCTIPIAKHPKALPKTVLKGAPGSYLGRLTLTLTGSLPEDLRYASTACKQPARSGHVEDENKDEDAEK